MSRPVVIIMVKAPREGQVKTRLVPPLRASDAASLAACFVQDAVDNARRVVPDIIVAYSPADGRAALEALLPHGLIWTEQQGENLGERLESVTSRAFKLGFAPVIVIGADSPTLPASFIETARDALQSEEGDAALGPTADGGYYLLGLRAPTGIIFQDVRWSTSHAFQDTLRNATRGGLRLHRLPPWYDVDEFSDLLRLRDEIFSDEQARRRAQATYHWLHAHDLPQTS